MPQSVEEFEHHGGLCPYLSICEVGRVDVAALQVVTASMARFGAGTQEQHSFPSSLKFNLNIVTSEGYFNVSRRTIESTSYNDEKPSGGMIWMIPKDVYNLLIAFVDK